MRIQTLKKEINVPNSLIKFFNYIYNHIPLIILYGNDFKRNYDFLKESQNWSADKLEKYQIQQLKKLLEHSYKNVPYYKKVFEEKGLKPEDIKSLDDLKLLPILTKEEIINNFKEFKPENYSDKQLEYVTTGGSTGVPLGFFYEKKKTNARELAFIKTLWDRVSYDFRDKVVVLRGDIISPNLVKKGQFWKYSFNKLIMSSYHMTDENLFQYVEKIREYNPKFMQCYPSSITLLAKFMQENNIKPFSNLKAILCGSENIYAWQRELIESVLECRVFSWYGHSEKAVLAGECEKSNFYHVFPEYGIVEFLDKDGNPAKENELAEIVATGFINFAFPFIRYKTMDLGTFSRQKCSCGRNHIIIKKIEGRLQEFIVSSKGRYISMVAINMHSDVFDNVKQFQFYQEKKGEVFFNVVKKDNYTKLDSDKIKKELSKKLGDDVDLKIKFMENIPRTPSGKYRFLIQKLNLKFGD